ncbi:hypothetical protein AUK41_03100 [Candidatus Berkelbacteria bacterium CG2_30_43_20]|nr:MAG: hypothetical protein AUK41_03100 [Candidatus Berkelbacteria bacterium CG2_30_43_20]
MSLTKQDIKEIKTAISDEIESFAIITSKTFDVMEKGFREEHEYNQKQFENIDKRFENIDKRFENIDKRFDTVDKRFDANDSAHRNMNARLDLIETDVSNLRSLHDEVRELRSLLEKAVTRHEYIVLEKRLTRIEKHLNLSPIR